MISIFLLILVAGDATVTVTFLSLLSGLDVYKRQVHVEDNDGQVVFLAHAGSRQVHDFQAAFQHFVVSDVVEMCIRDRPYTLYFIKFRTQLMLSNVTGSPVRSCNCLLYTSRCV